MSIEHIDDAIDHERETSGRVRRLRPGMASVSTFPMVTAPVGVSPLQGTLALSLYTEPPAVIRPGPEDRAAVERLVPRLCAVVIEVLGGDRGVQQLLRWTTEEVYDDLCRRMNALSATAGVDQRRRRLRAHVRSVRVSWPTSRAAEVSVHVRQGQRSRALAIRLELLEGRWLCSALQVG
ncbi:MAG: hypothetical protein EOO74_07175 [Myxococcales bacterium]|nr:MAG: hypothetical protein EOO74_07175 [Myxococcales bacterium]